MKRVLVTGATGFIGRHLVERLVHDGHEVRCLIRHQNRRVALPPVETEVEVVDLLDGPGLERVVRGCDQVIHLAARTSARYRSELYRTNSVGSRRLAEACARQSTPPHLLMVSSLAAAGSSIAGRTRREHDRARPISDYGRSKWLGEMEVVRLADRIPVSIVRPAIVFGPGNREMLPMFQSIARFHLHITPGYTARRVGLIYHDDLLEIIEQVLDHGQVVPPNFATHLSDENAQHDQGLYFAADANCPTFSELGRMISRALETSAVILPIPEVVAWLAAAGNQLAHFAIGRSDSFNLDKMREAFAGDWTSSTAKLSGLGFAPAKSLQERLNDTAHWYREHNWL